MNKMPHISVFIIVRNGEKYIREAIDSVFLQSYNDFELLLIDDGSTDDTINIIQQYKDKRIRYIQRGQNYILNLNEGLALSRGKYIARMDADDIMHSERLRVQVKRMEEYPHIAVCSSWMKNFNAENRIEMYHSLENEIENPLLSLLKWNFVYHPTVMIRRDFIERHHLHYQNYPCAEDYKLWTDIALQKGLFYVEPQALVFHRQSKSQVSWVKQEEMIFQAIYIRKEIINHFLEEWADQYSKNQLMLLNRILTDLEQKSVLDPEEVVRVFYNIFSRHFYPQVIKT